MSVFHNPRYSKEDFETFVVRMISVTKLKKSQIEAVLTQVGKPTSGAK